MKKSIIAALLLLSVLLTACHKTQPQETSQTQSGSTSGISPAVTSQVTTTDQKEEGGPTTAPETQMNEQIPSVSVQVGQNFTLTLPAVEKLKFQTTNNATKIGDIGFDSEKEECSVVLTGMIPGDCELLAISSDGSFTVIPVRVPVPAAAGEEICRSLDGTYLSESVSSPAAEGVEKAFDGKIDTKWLTKSKTGAIEVRLADSATYTIGAYTVTSGNDESPRDPKSWKLYGSVDGENWILVDERENQTFSARHAVNRYEIENPGAYSRYRMEITENNGGTYLQLAELSLYEIGGADAPDFTGITPTSAATLELTAPKSTLFEGESLTLNCKNGKEMKFASSDPAIAVGKPDFDESAGTVSVKLTAVGNVSGGKVVGLDADGKIGVFTLDAIGEGSYTYITDSIKATFTATADGLQTDPSAAFDRDRTTVLSAECRTLTLQVSFEAGRQILVNSYALVCGADHACDPTDWIFEGSVDGEKWTELDRRSGQTFEGNNLRRIFDTDNSDAYAHYRITLSGSGDTLALAQLQLIQSGAYPSSWALGPFVKLDAMNPILTPNSSDSFEDPITNGPVYWSEEALYNPTAVVKDDVVCLLYRSQDHPLISRVGLALSLDGTHFENYTDPVLFPDDEDDFYAFEEDGGCEDPRIVRSEDGTYYMYYTAYNRKTGVARLFVASSTDLKHWTKHGNAIGDAYNGKYKDFWAKSASVICDMVGDEFIARRMEDGKYWCYFGEGVLYTAYSDDLIHWTPLEDENGNLVVVLSGRDGKFDARLVECGPQAMYTEYGILLIYNGANADPKGSGDPMLIYNAYCPGMVLFDPHDHMSVLERTETFFMYPEKDYELAGLVNNVCFVEGLVYYHGSWYLYYGTADSRLAVAVYTPDPRDDSRLNEAIAKAEKVENPGEELSEALKIAKEASASALYKQEWVDEIADRLNALI
ncbi:MAG: discoidin domain-containing protein [Eubacteriales bacterium]